MKVLKMSVFALIAGVRRRDVINEVGLREIKKVYEDAYKDLSSLESKPALLTEFLEESSGIITEFVKNFDSL